MAPDKQEENYYTFWEDRYLFIQFFRLPKKMAK